MISKELLNAVYPDELSIVNADSISCRLKESQLIVKCKYLHTKLRPTFYYNIYELAHKCKEWALNLGYILYSTIYGYECYIDSRSFIDNTPIRFLAGSEPEAIFKACQWILDNKDNK